MRPILIRGARQLLTLRGPSGPRRGADLRNLGIIQDGAVLIDDGIIREVGPTRRIENLSTSRHAEEIDAHGRVVMPGFVDSHTHLVSGPPRLNDLELMAKGISHGDLDAAGGGYRAVTKTIQEMPIKSLETQASRILQAAISHGTTTIEAKSGYGSGEMGELKTLRAQGDLNYRFAMVVSTFLAARPRPEDETPHDYVNWLIDHMLPLVQRRKLAEFVDADCDVDGLGIDDCRRVLERARQLGMGLKLHTNRERDSGGIRLGVELEAASVDHAIHVDDRDLVALARSNVIATLLPGPVFVMSAGTYAPARAMIDQGVAVALATDYNPHTCPIESMQMIVSLGCLKMKMTPAEAVSAATINGAHALRRADQTGSIEFGKYADLVILNVSDYREIPYHFGANLVDVTMKAGKVVYESAKVTCGIH